MLTFKPRYLISIALALASAAASAAPMGEAILRFEGAIGVDPLTAAGGADVSNVVRGINPGGRAWVIRKLEATVYADARVMVSGKGLLFASGDVIATRGTVTHVAATLACGPRRCHCLEVHHCSIRTFRSGQLQDSRSSVGWRQHCRAAGHLRQPSIADQGSQPIHGCCRRLVCRRHSRDTGLTISTRGRSPRLTADRPNHDGTLGPSAVFTVTPPSKTTTGPTPIPCPCTDHAERRTVRGVHQC